MILMSSPRVHYFEIKKNKIIFRVRKNGFFSKKLPEKNFQEIL